LGFNVRDQRAFTAVQRALVADEQKKNAIAFSFRLVLASALRYGCAPAVTPLRFTFPAAKPDRSSELKSTGFKMVFYFPSCRVASYRQESSQFVKPAFS
jgi:hypothetical protein